MGSNRIYKIEVNTGYFDARTPTVDLDGTPIRVNPEGNCVVTVPGPVREFSFDIFAADNTHPCEELKRFVRPILPLLKTSPRRAVTRNRR